MKHTGYFKTAQMYKNYDKMRCQQERENINGLQGIQPNNFAQFQV